MSRTTAVLTAGWVGFGAVGCGETYIDEEAGVTTPESALSTTLPPIAADSSIDDLLARLLEELDGLSAAIIAEDHPDQILDRVNRIWEALEPKLADDPATWANISSAVDFANLAVDRKRPADADKAVIVVSDQLDARS